MKKENKNNKSHDSFLIIGDPQSVMDVMWQHRKEKIMYDLRHKLLSPEQREELREELAMMQVIDDDKKGK